LRVKMKIRDAGLGRFRGLNQWRITRVRAPIIREQRSSATEIDPTLPRILGWVDYDNHQRYHEAIDDVIPADKYYGGDCVILKRGKRSAQRP
jgi:hypothetical protein